VLVRPRNPLNIGAAARAMSNFGVHRLRLVNPYHVAFREARSAVNAEELLREAEEFKTVADAVADCALVVGTTAVRNRALQHPLRRLDQRSASIIRKQLRSGRVALLFGSEKSGLTNEDFSHCHWLLHIDTQPGHISMNLAQAVAVCLYELTQPAPSGKARSDKDRSDKDRSNKLKTEVNPATAGHAEQIATAMLESLRISGYVKPGTEVACEKKVRSLVLRLNLKTIDAEVLLGMFRQILWKLRQTR
jgi:TrmH family RNA methyltransferase